MPRRITALTASVALAVALLVACTADRPRDERPTRVVVIVIDTLRPDHLGFYGYPRETAPWLASLAARGTVFERAHSTSSWTAPSTSSLFTGVYPTRHGVTTGFFAHRQLTEMREHAGEAVMPLGRLPDDLQLLSERFRAAGYRTYGAATNVNIGPELGFDRGFDVFEYAQNMPADALFERLEGWQAELADDRTRSFLYLHLNDVHSPYQRRAPWYRPASGRADRISAYDSGISFLDQQLSRLAERLAWDDRTLLAVLSDHGEEFGEHGGKRHDGGLHRELTRVLMLFAGPGVPVSRSQVDVSLVDVLPTLLTLAGIEPGADPTEQPLDGRDLTALMRSEPASDDDAADWEARPLLAHRAMMGERHGGHWWAVMRDGWKLIDTDGELELFDQRSDPFEHADRAAAEPDRTRVLRAELEALRKGGLRASESVTEVPLDASLLESLEALGYVEADPTAPPPDPAREEAPRASPGATAEPPGESDRPDPDAATRP